MFTTTKKQLFFFHFADRQRGALEAQSSSQRFSSRRIEQGAKYLPDVNTVDTENQSP
jgi:hypothetical protein